MILGRRGGFGIETDALACVICSGRLSGLAGCDTALGHRLASLQQTLRAHDHAIVGNELLVADFQFFTAFRAGPAHSAYRI